LDPLIRTLVRFQELSLEVARLDARLSQIPAEIKAIDEEQRAAAASVARAKGSVAEAQKRKRDHERELQDLEGKISKYNDQSRDVKTNEQYRAIMHEIENVREQIGQVEEKILFAMEDIDSHEGVVREEEKSVNARKGEFDARRSTLSSEKEEVSRDRNRAAAERDVAARDVPPDAMEIYNRMARMRSGVAMARARDERCSGCNVRVRPQVFADVRKNNQIIQCESCKRILYYLEESPRGEAGTEDAAAPSEPA
jgi:predicted  nucleic acid-binding Zn-ribbon protein